MLEELERELGPVSNQPFEPFVPHDEKLHLRDGHRGCGSRRVPEQRHLSEQSAFLHQVEATLTRGIALDDLDGAHVDHVRFSVRVIALLENDYARSVVTPLDVALREVSVDLDPDRGEVRFALHGQTRVGPRAESALEDPDIAPPLAAQEPGDLGARTLLRARAERDDELFLVDR
jgi:hypothetical protein